MSTYAITGTSRGIGLEMVRQLSQAPASKVKAVIAITRNKNSAALNDLVAKSCGRVHNIAISDITDENTIQNALPELEKALPDGTLDVLINNAGMTDDYKGNGLAALRVENLMEVIKTNVGSVQAVTATLLPLLEKGHGKTVLNISTSVGSIALAERYVGFENYSYKTSKAALNMLTVQYALKYGKQGFTVFAMSPGWIQTELGSSQADLSVEEGVQAVLDRLAQADASYNGKFFNIKTSKTKRPDGSDKYDGAEVPW